MGKQLIAATIFMVLIAAACWASPDDSDLSICQASGHTRETCIHAVMP